MKKVRIKDRLIGEGESCFVIAEAGSNHNGSFEQAKALIDIAAWAEADAVKFQTFRAERMYPKSSGSVGYLKKLGIKKSIYTIIKELEMPFDWIPELAKYCERKKIMFLSTSFDEECIDIIDPYVPAFKIASYELTHIPLIEYIAKKKKPLIISTGASDVDEISTTVKSIYAVGNKRICLMQCTAKYPAPLENINIRAIDSLSKKFDIPVGLSDHSRHPLYASLAAVARGANLIEKHFTLSNHLPGPDHKFALEPSELKEMIKGIRMIERTLGKSKKTVQDVEEELVNFKRGIYTKKAVKKGEILSKDNLIILRRPGTIGSALSPKQIDKIIGKRVKRDLSLNHCVGPDDLE